MRPLITTIALLFAVTLSAVTRAQDIVDPELGFRMTLDAQGGQVCFIVPTKLRAPECPELDEAVARGAADSLATASIEYDNGSFIVVVTRSSEVRGMNSKEDLDAFIDAVQEGLGGGHTARVHGRTPDVRYDLLDGPPNGIRFHVDIDYPADDPRANASRMLHYTLISRDGFVNVAFASNADGADAMREVADRMMSGVEMTTSEEDGAFGKANGYRLGYHGGKLFFRLSIFVGLISLLAFWIVRERKKKRENREAWEQQQAWQQQQAWAQYHQAQAQQQAQQATGPQQQAGAQPWQPPAS